MHTSDAVQSGADSGLRFDSNLEELHRPAATCQGLTGTTCTYPCTETCVFYEVLNVLTSFQCDVTETHPLAAALVRT